MTWLAAPLCHPSLGLVIGIKSCRTQTFVISLDTRSLDFQLYRTFAKTRSNLGHTIGQTKYSLLDKARRSLK